MILCDIADSTIADSIHPGLATALTWLRAHAGDTFTPGEIVLEGPDGRDIIVKCEQPALMPRERVSLEAHRNYIDVHVPLKSTETIGWAPVKLMKHPRGAYDPERDIIFYGDGANSLLHLPVGQMAVFFPSDAHAPNIGLGNHRKLCIKIPV